MSAGVVGHLWLEMAPPHPAVVWGEVPVAVDSPAHPLPQPGQSQPPSLATLWTNWLLPEAPPQSTTLSEATGGPHPLWHHILDFPQLVWVPSLWWMSPNTSTWSGWGTGSALEQCPYHRESPGGLLDSLRTWIACISGCQSASSC